VTEAVKADFLKQAGTLGFATDELIWVDHSGNGCETSTKG